MVASRGFHPRSIVEPTCGLGSFLRAAAETFPCADRLIGADINPDYLSALASAIEGDPNRSRYRLLHANFFTTDWEGELSDLADPILVIGNPPWVTSSTQGTWGGTNLPTKENSQGWRGIDAITGRSNFDVSQWMLQRLCEVLQGRHALLAMLCKTAVARRVLETAWRTSLAVRSAELHAIDARAAFGAAVTASLFLVEFTGQSRCDSATCFLLGPALGHAAESRQIGWRDGRLVADLDAYVRYQARCAAADGSSSCETEPDDSRWRSGVKHDCAPVMELVGPPDRLKNGWGEPVDVEPEHVFPLLKSGEIAGRRRAGTPRWLLLPQRRAGEETGGLEHTAPRTWRYLQQHAGLLDARRSSIYRRQPRFAVFGVGDYTFAPWKVAVSGLAKNLRFRPVGPQQGRPVVLDDASYFLPCRSQTEAERIAKLLHSPAAADYFQAFVFWDAKRPLTAEILRRLDLVQLQRALDPHLSQSVDHSLDDPE